MSQTKRNERCGVGFGGSICGNDNPYGQCCSQYGFCGNTSEHCSLNNKCQSGCWQNPSSSSTLPSGTEISDNSSLPKQNRTIILVALGVSIVSFIVFSVLVVILMKKSKSSYKKINDLQIELDTIKGQIVDPVN